jgi:hypothetical protein
VPECVPERGCVELDALDGLTYKIRSWMGPLPDLEVQPIETGENHLPVVAVFLRKGPFAAIWRWHDGRDDQVPGPTRKGGYIVPGFAGPCARACSRHTFRRTVWACQLLQVGVADPFSDDCYKLRGSKESRILLQGAATTIRQRACSMNSALPLPTRCTRLPPNR